MKKNALLPSAITSLRLVTLPLLVFFLYRGDTALFLAIFLFSSSTDLVDGYVARKFNAISRKGAYFDSIADFCVIISVFLVYSIKGFFPYWIPAMIIFSFALFMITSLHRERIYDPVGKYFGGFLYVTIAVLTVAPALNMLACIVIPIFFFACVASRIACLLFPRRFSGSAKSQEIKQD